MNAASARVSALVVLASLVASSARAQGGLMQLVAYGAQDVYLTAATVPTTFAGRAGTMQHCEGGSTGHIGRIDI